jgi:microcystin degradation protein MlrC
MENLMRVARNMALSDPRILDISLLGGFFCSERPETGISAVVTTNREPNLARDLAEELKAACWAKRHAFHTDMVSVQEAVNEAIQTDDGPVVLGDLADSGGAGTPGDGTALLVELLKQKAQRAVIGSIADPEAVKEAIRVGVGKDVTLTVGGKVDRFHGEPVQISGRVRTIHDGVFAASTRFNAGTVHRGPTAVVDCGGVEVVLTSRPVLVFEPNHFRSLGIEPTQRKILVCKSEMQHRPGLEGIGRTFIDVDTPGLATQVLSRLPYSRIRRPVFPLDDI